MSEQTNFEAINDFKPHWRDKEPTYRTRGHNDIQLEADVQYEWSHGLKEAYSEVVLRGDPPF